STNSNAALTSSGSGAYTAPNLTPGTYRVEVSAPGFKRTTVDSVVVSASSTIRLDVTMQLGQVSEAIEVSASAVQLQTENARTSTLVQNKLVDELPLVVGGAMRSPFNLVSIAAEARGDGNRLALGGGQAAAWDATLDGHSVGTNRSAETAEAALNSPSVEALTEFTVDTNGFKAEYGQAGGGVMTFVSKSGTNQLHGSAYDFLRNEKLDARRFFASRREVYKQNDYGATLGGPVVIPKLYDGRNKTFFFFSFEGFRNREGATDVIRSVPTPEMYEGDFSRWVGANGQVIPIYDPATTRPNPNGTGFIRDQFPNNQIPKSRFSALSQRILPFAQGVKPNRATAIPGTVGYVTNNWISGGGTETTPTDKWSIKVDQMLSAKQRVNFLHNGTRFRRSPGAAGPPGLPLPLWDGQAQAYDTKAYRVTHDYTVSSNLLNHFSFAANTFVKNSFSPNMGQNWKDKVCLKNVVDCNVNFANIRFTEYSPWGGVAENGTSQPGWGLKNDLSYIRGSHSFKFGYAFQDQRANGFGQQDISGRAMFSFLSTSVPGATTLTSGNSFASFLLGDAFFGRTETIRAITQYFRYHGLYAQDDWRISRKLTLNLGLRYDVTMPPISATDEYSDFTPDRPNPAAGGRLGALRFAGEGPGREGTSSLVPGWYGGWGPRVGLAYALTPKTTIRTGFGRSFSRVTAVQGSGHFAGFIGQYEFNNTSQGVTPTFNLDNGLPSYVLPPSINPSFSNGNTVDWWQGQEATRAPENLFWTFSIQRQLTGSTVLEVAYNANIGTHLQTGVLNFNQVPTSILDGFVAQYGPTQALNLLRANIDSPQAVAAGIPIPYPNFVNERVKTVNQALRPYPQYQNIVTGVQNGDKSGHSSYHALVVKADRRFASGLMFQWNYTFSKC
ncbi:MAG: TonB-dependent receptor, partial [Bryobacteraceae bacterium]